MKMNRFFSKMRKNPAVRIMAFLLAVLLAFMPGMMVVYGEKAGDTVTPGDYYTLADIVTEDGKTVFGKDEELVPIAVTVRPYFFLPYVAYGQNYWFLHADDVESNDQFFDSEGKWRPFEETDSQTVELNTTNKSKVSFSFNRSQGPHTWNGNSYNATNTYQWYDNGSFTVSNLSFSYESDAEGNRTMKLSGHISGTESYSYTSDTSSSATIGDEEYTYAGGTDDVGTVSIDADFSNESFKSDGSEYFSESGGLLCMCDVSGTLNVESSRTWSDEIPSVTHHTNGEAITTALCLQIESVTLGKVDSDNQVTDGDEGIAEDTESEDSEEVDDTEDESETKDDDTKQEDTSHQEKEGLDKTLTGDDKHLSVAGTAGVAGVAGAIGLLGGLAGLGTPPAPMPTGEPVPMEPVPGNGVPGEQTPPEPMPSEQTTTEQTPAELSKEEQERIKEQEELEKAREEIEKQYREAERELEEFKKNLAEQKVKKEKYIQKLCDKYNVENGKPDTIDNLKKEIKKGSINAQIELGKYQAEIANIEAKLALAEGLENGVDVSMEFTTALVGDEMKPVLAGYYVAKESLKKISEKVTDISYKKGLSNMNMDDLLDVAQAGSQGAANGSITALQSLTSGKTKYSLLVGGEATKDMLDTYVKGGDGYDIAKAGFRGGSRGGVYALLAGTLDKGQEKVFNKINKGFKLTDKFQDRAFEWGVNSFTSSTKVLDGNKAFVFSNGKTGILTNKAFVDSVTNLNPNAAGKAIGFDEAYNKGFAYLFGGQTSHADAARKAAQSITDRIPASSPGLHT